MPNFAYIASPTRFPYFMRGLISYFSPERALGPFPLNYGGIYELTMLC